MRGGEPLHSWFWCPSLICSVQDFLQDVATNQFQTPPSPSLLSLSLYSRLSLCFPHVSLSLEKKRETHGETERERERSASNLKCSLAVLLWVLTPVCIEANPAFINTKLHSNNKQKLCLKGEPGSHLSFILLPHNRVLCIWMQWVFACLTSCPSLSDLHVCS